MGYGARHLLALIEMEELSALIAGAALMVSIVVAYQSYRWRVIDGHRAEVTAYFHRNREFARVRVEGDEVRSGYSLVLWNRGPAEACRVNARFTDADGMPLRLVALVPDEFPITRLPSAARYPTPWIVEPQSPRMVWCELTWVDKNGDQRMRLPLRRGETST